MPAAIDGVTGGSPAITDIAELKAAIANIIDRGQDPRTTSSGWSSSWTVPDRMTCRCVGGAGGAPERLRHPLHLPAIIGDVVVKG